MSIVVTGGSGLVGSKFKKYNVIRLSSKDYDLRDYNSCLKMIDDTCATQIIHCSASVGGVLGNMTFAADYLRNNILMNINILESARVKGIKKVISLLSTCIFPDKVEYPIVEKSLHNGPPHESNASYAHAKRLIDVSNRAYRKQYNCNFISAIPNNLYGPDGDNYTKLYSHVVPAIIRKIFEAKIQKENSVLLWGDGSPLRELTYAEDIADIIMLLLDSYDNIEPINIGNPEEVSIMQLAEIIKSIMKYNGNITWDTSMPAGQFRKPSSNAKFMKLYPDFKYTPIEEGLIKTCKWFEENYPNIRGI